MDDPSWNRLVCVVTLLTESEVFFAKSTAIPLLAEQLLYLAHGEHALGNQDHEATPPRDNIPIPQALWEALQKIPLSLDYYSKVEQSLQTHPQFWEGFAGDTSGNSTDEGGEELRGISDFPWRDTASAVGLDDYVMLKFLREDLWLAKVSQLMMKVCVYAPLLNDVLQDNSKDALLLFYDESCPRSQAFVHDLERKIREIMTVSANFTCRFDAK